MTNMTMPSWLACATHSSLPADWFHTETSGCFAFILCCRKILYQGEILALVQQPGVNPHQGESPWHDLWWWYHETNTEPQKGTGVILDVSYWRCGGVPSERMKSSPGVEPRTCRCWVRARIGKRTCFPVQELLDDGHQLDCDGLALTPIWALVTFDTPQHTL